jgi:uncharacterized membrane protein YjjP (DUF1212 family)
MRDQIAIPLLALINADLMCAKSKKKQFISSRVSSSYLTCVFYFKKTQAGKIMENKASDVLISIDHTRPKTVTLPPNTPQQSMNGFILDEGDRKDIILPSEQRDAKSKRMEQRISVGKMQWSEIKEGSMQHTIEISTDEVRSRGTFRRKISNLARWLKERTKKPSHPATAAVTYSAMTASEQQKVRSLIIDLGFALATYGVPAPRLEYLLGVVSSFYGLHGTYYALPTVIWFTFLTDKEHTDSSNSHMHYVRLTSGAINLNKQAQLDHLAQNIADGEIDNVEIACKRVQEIVQAKQMYATLWVPIVNTLFIASSMCFMIGGTWAEISSSGVGGAFVGLINYFRTRNAFLSKVGNVVASFVAGLIAIVLAGFLYSQVDVRVDPIVSAIGSILVLIPSAQIAMGIQELNAGTFLSGAIRLASVAIRVLELGFGLLIVEQLSNGVRNILDHSETLTVIEYPVWSKVLAVPILAFCFTIQLRLPREKVAYITVLIANVIAFLGTTYLKIYCGSEAAGLVSAFFVGVVATIYSYATKRPRVLIISCAIFSLLPCYLSGAGMRSLLLRDPSSALATTFLVMTVSVAIVMGLIASEFIIPHKKQFLL